MKFNRILVVDDDADICKTLAMVLCDYLVITAENGQKALEMMANNDGPCLVILDYQMPVMDGRGFLRELRKYDTESIVYIHSGTHREVEGCNGFIEKPSSMAKILEIAKERVYGTAMEPTWSTA